MLSAVVLANVLNALVTLAIGHLPFSTGLSISVLLVFTGIIWAFNNYLWRWPVTSKLAGVPNLRGKWIGPLDSSYQVENGDGPIRPEFTIHQTWTRIEVNADFAKSRSESTSASFITDKGRPQLVFTYRNYPRDSSSNQGPHAGTNTLRCMTDSNGRPLLQGEYYTDQQRNNHGTMELRRPCDVEETDG